MVMVRSVSEHISKIKYRSREGLIEYFSIIKVFTSSWTNPGWECVWIVGVQINGLVHLISLENWLDPSLRERLTHRSPGHSGSPGNIRMSFSTQKKKKMMTTPGMSCRYPEGPSSWWDLVTSSSTAQGTSLGSAPAETEMDLFYSGKGPFYPHL